MIHLFAMMEENETMEEMSSNEPEPRDGYHCFYIPLEQYDFDKLTDEEDPYAILDDHYLIYVSYEAYDWLLNQGFTPEQIETWNLHCSVAEYMELSSQILKEFGPDAILFEWEL